MTGIPDRADRVVVVGSGSAGRRHLAALRAALPAAQLTVVRRDVERPAGEVETGADQVVSSVAEAVEGGCDLGVVAGPAPFHEHAATALAAAGADVLVEKPLADDVEAAARLVDAVRDAGRRLVVGYHLRLSDTVPALRRAVQAGSVGTPTWFDLRVGQHLSGWRPGTDPAASVTARAELGGGVLLELSHELDGLRYLLGDVEVERATVSRDGAPTDGLVETVADLMLRTTGGARGTVHLDMVSDPPERTWRVGGPDGELVADLLAGTVTRIGTDPGDRELLANAEPGERDRAESRLIAHLLDVHAGRVEPVCTGADGVAAVEVVAAARRLAASEAPEPPRRAAVAP